MMHLMRRNAPPYEGPGCAAEVAAHRLECLKLAATLGPKTPDELTEYAEQIMKWFLFAHIQENDPRKKAA